LIFSLEKEAKASLSTPKNLISFWKKETKRKAHISYLMGFTDGTRRPKVSSLRLIWLTTLIFCLRHRCTKNQSLQVFGRVEQRFKGIFLQKITQIQFQL